MTEIEGEQLFQVCLEEMEAEGQVESGYLRAGPELGLSSPL